MVYFLFLSLEYCISAKPKLIFSADGKDDHSVFASGDLLLTTQISLDSAEVLEISVGGWVKVSQVESGFINRK
jgi:hypothetical protein